MFNGNRNQMGQLGSVFVELLGVNLGCFRVNKKVGLWSDGAHTGASRVQQHFQRLGLALVSGAVQRRAARAAQLVHGQRP